MATLEIHQINVSQGDATLIVVRNIHDLREAVKQEAPQAALDDMNLMPWCVRERRNDLLRAATQGALLVDAGNDDYGPDVRWYMEHVGALQPKDTFQEKLSILVTHCHDDHQDGVRSLLRDRDGPNTKEVFRPKCFYHPQQTNDSNMGLMPTILRELNSQDASKDKRKTTVVTVPPGGCLRSGDQMTIALGDGPNKEKIVARVLAAGRKIFAGPHLAPQDAGPKVKSRQGKEQMDENDRSIVLAIEYGKFRHFLGGDAGGSDGMTYADIETPLAKVLKNDAWNGHCCTMKLNHHGSRYSNDRDLLDVIRPRIVTIPSGIRLNFHKHPTSETLQRLHETNGLEKAFATEIASRGKGIAFDPKPLTNVEISGDIVIRPYDNTINEKEIRIKIVRSGEQSIIVDPIRYQLRPATASDVEVVCSHK